MIEINLVPEHLRKKRKTRVTEQKRSRVPREAVIGLVGGIILLLLGAHIGLQYFISMKFVEHKKLENEKNEILPEKMNVEKAVEDLNKLRGAMKSMEEISRGRQLLWSQIFNEISDNITRGTWLNKMIFNDDTLLIYGSAILRDKTEMFNVHDFITRLKDSEGLMTYVGNVELGMIKSRTINTTPIADFTIKIDLK